MTDPTKWQTLFDKCPDLRPPTLTFIKLSSDAPMEGMAVWDEIQCAMIRDKAVWWLQEQLSNEMKHGRYESLQFYRTPGGNEVSFSESAFRTNHVWSVAPDRTEALRLACCKVLGVSPD